MPSDVDVAWAAGLYEGEGTFVVNRTKGRPAAVQLSLTMNEEWPVRRFAEITGARLTGPYPPYGKETRPRSQARINRRSELARVFWAFKDHLGPRRRAQIKRVIREARRERREFLAAQPPKVCGHCGCPRDQCTEGCRSCYMRFYMRGRNNATR